MTTERQWNLIAQTVDADTARMYVAAQVAGVKVIHSSDYPCFTFESVAGNPGTFRKIGLVQFNKRTRRWSVKARNDCTSVDLSTLIDVGLVHSERFGQSPGHGLRRRMWKHGLGDDGYPYAWAYVSRRVTVDELLGTVETSVTVPNNVHELLVHPPSPILGSLS